MGRADCLLKVTRTHAEISVVGHTRRCERHRLTTGGAVVRRSIRHAGRDVSRLRDQRDTGFTVTELMVVVLVIGILVLIAVASYVPATQRAAAVACAHNRATLERALDAHAARTTGTLPATTTIDVLRPYVSNPDESTRCPSDGSPYTLDVAARTVSCPNHP